MPPKKSGRPQNLTKSINKLKKLGVFSRRQAIALGILKSSLSRLVKSGEVENVGLGFYLHSQSSVVGEERDYAIACSKFGKHSAIGGLSALFHHRLIEQVPNRIWILVPYSRKTTLPLYRCIRTGADLKRGIENRNSYRITNLERSIIEAFRYSSKIGLRVAVKALRVAIVEKRTTLARIQKQARALGYEKFIEPYWELLIPESGANL